MKQIRRRSIVEFEKWLDMEISIVKSDLEQSQAAVEALARQRASSEIKLDTLLSVKAKLAPVGDPATGGLFDDVDDDATVEQPTELVTAQ